MKDIAAALLKAQGLMSNAKKGSDNPYFKSRYADLNAVREAVIPPLTECGIVVLQPIVSIDGKNYVRTVLIHAESGQTVESLTEIVYKSPNDPQQYGSGITYARRYGLQSLVCIGADDDDANGAQGRRGAPAPAQQPAPAPPPRPKLGAKAYQQALDRIRGGELTLMTQLMESYDLTREQHDRLGQALVDYKINNNIK